MKFTLHEKMFSKLAFRATKMCVAKFANYYFFFWRKKVFYSTANRIAYLFCILKDFLQEQEEEEETDIGKVNCLQ